MRVLGNVLISFGVVSVIEQPRGAKMKKAKISRQGVGERINERRSPTASQGVFFLPTITAKLATSMASTITQSPCTRTIGSWCLSNGKKKSDVGKKDESSPTGLEPAFPEEPVKKY